MAGLVKSFRRGFGLAVEPVPRPGEEDAGAAAPPIAAGSAAGVAGPDRASAANAVGMTAAAPLAASQVV